MSDIKRMSDLEEKNYELQEFVFIVYSEQELKEDRLATVFVSADWKTENDVKVVDKVHIDDITFEEQPGNYFSVKNWSKENITKDYIELIINDAKIPKEYRGYHSREY